MSPAGYSGTPLARKLGLKSCMRLAVIDAPDHYWSLLPDRPEELEAAEPTASSLDFVHLFVRERAGLAGRLRRLKRQIVADGMIWVSWPKRASGVNTDVTGDGVRAEALAAGWWT